MTAALALYLLGAAFVGAILVQTFETSLGMIQAENPDASPRLIRVVGVVVYTVLTLLWPLVIIGGLVRLARRG